MIGRRLGVPFARQTSVEAARHFGWFAAIASLNASASSVRTGERFGWTRVSPGCSPISIGITIFRHADQGAMRVASQTPA